MTGLFWAVAAAALALDVGSKLWAVRSLEQAVTVLPGILELRLSRNNGMALGLLSGNWLANLLLPLAVIGSAIIGVILILFANKKIHDNPYLLILNCQDENAENTALSLMKEAVKKYAVKSKTVNAQGIEFTAEIRMKDGETAFVNRLNEIAGVENATLVSYNGEYMS